MTALPISEAAAWAADLELTEQQIDTPARQCHTKDNVPVMANASVYWRITDPCKALYEVDILPQSVSDIALNALRSNIGTLDLDALLSERAQLNERIASQLSETAKKWGVLFTRVEVQELKEIDSEDIEVVIDDETSSSMEEIDKILDGIIEEK